MRVHPKFGSIHADRVVSSLRRGGQLGDQHQHSRKHRASSRPQGRPALRWRSSRRLQHISCLFHRQSVGDAHDRQALVEGATLTARDEGDRFSLHHLRGDTAPSIRSIGRQLSGGHLEPTAGAGRHTGTSSRRNARLDTASPGRHASRLPTRCTSGPLARAGETRTSPSCRHRRASASPPPMLASATALCRLQTHTKVAPDSDAC